MPNAQRAFTLIEIIVVVALVMMLAGFGLVVGMQTYHGYTFRTERDMLVATLQRARSQAVNNMCFGSACTAGAAHGVHVGAHEYILFQGESYAARDASVDEVVAARYLGTATTAPSFTDIVFSPLAGTTTANPADVMVISLMDTAGKDSSIITINSEGQITWTN